MHTTFKVTNCDLKFGRFRHFHLKKLEKVSGEEIIDADFTQYPLFALKRTYAAPKPQLLSYSEYYARYGTTEEKDGWKMENPTGQKVVYVKITV